MKAYFNGVSGVCNVNNSTNITAVHQGSVTSYAFDLVGADYGYCDPNDATLFDITLIGLPVTDLKCPTTLPTSVAGGSNARQALATGVGELEAMNDEVRAYPNPTDGIINVSLNTTLSTAERVALSIYNSLGALVKTITFNGQKTQNLVIDFNELQVENGFYFIQVKAGNNKASFKAMYNSNK